MLAGQGKARHRLVLAGGVVVAGSLAAVAAAHSVAVLLVAFVAFFPASGAFVSLTQAALMDAAPGRHQQRMAAWNLAGSAGAVGGPLLLAGVLAIGGDWRTAYLVLAAAAGAALAVAFLAAPSRQGAAASSDAEDHDDARDGHNGDGGQSGAGGQSGDDGENGERASVRDALRAVRQGGVARWVVLLEISDLLLDVLTGYVGIYLVDVVGASPAQAAVGVAVRLGAGLAGDALFVVVSRRISGPAALRASADRRGRALSGVPAGALVAWQACDPGGAQPGHGLLVSGRPGRALHSAARPERRRGVPVQRGRAGRCRRSGHGRPHRPGGGTDLGARGAGRGAGCRAGDPAFWIQAAFP